MLLYVFFFFKQKTAYEMRISDWSSDVCSSDLLVEQAGDHDRDASADEARDDLVQRAAGVLPQQHDQCTGHDAGKRADAGHALPEQRQIGRASCRERVCQYV